MLGISQFLSFRDYNREYKNFHLKYLENNLSGDVKCFAHKDPYMEQWRDEHGRLQQIAHDSETFSFIVAYQEFLIEDCSPEEVIYNRFIAEVDYYLNHNEKSEELKQPDILSQFEIRQYEEPNLSLIRKYHCPCCGTDFTTDKAGYTPQCNNCGARMIQDT
jgi:DNA-directed RNA polymerase subunit RPC12/RpoP